MEDAFGIAAHLRNEDLIELRSSDNVRPPYRLLMEGIGFSKDDCWTIEALNGDIIAIFGAADLGNGVGSVWLLGTNKIKKIKGEFLRHSRFWVEKLQDKYPVLTNYIFAENYVHLKWIKWLGFTIIRKIDNYGTLGLPFYEFIRIKS
jgi:hypothetical protein